MRVPRDVSADRLAKALQKFGYFVSHQKGSHIRVTTIQNGQHHETIPNHTPLKNRYAFEDTSQHCTASQFTVGVLLSELEL